MDDPHPAIGQRTDRHAVAFALAPLALIIGYGPRLLEGRLPGKLVEGIAEGFDTGIAPMGV